MASPRTVIIGFLVAAIVAVAGCQTQQTSVRKTYNTAPGKKPERYTSSESLLEAEGYWDLVEEEEEISPLAQHMQARVQVDPNQTKGHTRYTSYKNPNEKTHVRVLRVASSEIVVPEKKPEKQKTGFKTAKPGFLSSKLKTEEKDLPVAKGVPTPEAKPLLMAEKEEPQEQKSSWFRPKSTEEIEEKQEKVVSAGSTVMNIRMGEHPGKTRFVLDLTGPSAFEYEVNNDKGYLLVELPGTDWQAARKEVLASHNLIKGYSVRTDKKGSKLLVAFKKPGRLIVYQSLPPNSARGHRIYFDIGTAG